MGFTVSGVLSTLGNSYLAIDILGQLGGCSTRLKGLSRQIFRTRVLEEKKTKFKLGNTLKSFLPLCADPQFPLL